jgi:rhamnosyltransferase
MDQFRRKFDEGVSHAENSKVFKIGSEGKAGCKYGMSVVSYLFNQKYYMEIADFVGESLFKAAGYFLGRNYKLLKKDWILNLTNNHAYWSK